LDNKRVLVDTSILIDFFRKKNRKKSILYKLQGKHEIYISTITEFEFLAGVKEERTVSINSFFKNLEVIGFDSKAAIIASSIYKDLKSKNQIIEFRDIFIAATAIANRLPLSTLNIEHFKRVENLEIV
jgi:predicted nucleic acid-binding protein